MCSKNLYYTNSEKVTPAFLRSSSTSTFCGLVFTELCFYSAFNLHSDVLM